MNPLRLAGVAALLLAGCASSDYVELGDPETFYLRSALSGWELDPQYQLQPLDDSGKRFAVEASFSASAKPYFVKLADEEWQGGANCGPKQTPVDESLLPGQPVQVSCNEPRRSFKLLVESDSRYRFIFDSSGEVPTLSVEKL